MSLYIYIYSMYIFTLNATVLVEDFRSIYVCMSAMGLGIYGIEGSTYMYIYIVLYNCQFAMLRRDLPVIVPVSILLLYNCLYVYWKLLLHAHASRITLTSHVSHVSCLTLWQRFLVLFPTGRCTNGRES